MFYFTAAHPISRSWESMHWDDGITPIAFDDASDAAWCKLACDTHCAAQGYSERVIVVYY